MFYYRSRPSTHSVQRVRRVGEICCGAEVRARNQDRGNNNWARSLSQVSKGEEMRNEKIWVSTNNKTLCNLFCGNLSFASPSHFVDVVVGYDLSCLFVFPPVEISSPWLWSALCCRDPDRTGPLSHPTSKIGVRKKLSWHMAKTEKNKALICTMKSSEEINFKRFRLRSQQLWTENFKALNIPIFHKQQKNETTTKELKITLFRTPFHYITITFIIRAVSRSNSPELWFIYYISQLSYMSVFFKFVQVSVSWQAVASFLFHIFCVCLHIFFRLLLTLQLR